jgi:5-methylcytosine-specific restriction endonuclease McrA
MAAVVPLVLARSRGWCECEQTCGTRGEQFHHVVRKSQGGTNTLDNLRHLSAACHAKVHANVAWAREVGLLKSRSYE